MCSREPTERLQWWPIPVLVPTDLPVRESGDVGLPQPGLATQLRNRLADALIVREAPGNGITSMRGIEHEANVFEVQVCIAMRPVDVGTVSCDLEYGMLVRRDRIKRRVLIHRQVVEVDQASAPRPGSSSISSTRAYPVACTRRRRLSLRVAVRAPPRLRQEMQVRRRSAAAAKCGGLYGQVVRSTGRRRACTWSPRGELGFGGEIAEGGPLLAFHDALE